MLVNAGATHSLVSIEKEPFAGWEPVQTPILEGFDGSKQRVGFTANKIIQIGSTIGNFCFGLFELNDTRILGSDLMSL